MKPVKASEPIRTPRSVVMGTAGHIDHGKTALVLALTGTDTDRLPEEKSRGITIDLGFAALDLKNERGEVVHLGLVDVPGHQAFIHNMLAGAGGIDCVMLVVAATEGIKAQTEEHLAICTLLGVRHGVVALTKSDAVSPERLEEARQQVRHFVQHTFLESAPILAVSAHSGAGMAALKSALIELALGVPEHSQDTFLRLPLDRAFSVPGFGTIITGTLRDGTLGAGDTVEIQPGDRTARVRGIQVHHQAVQQVQAPTRVALNLAGVEVGDLHRGETIVQKGKLSPVSTLDVELTVLAGARPVKHRSRLNLHAFAAESPATVLLYDNGTDMTPGTRLARLRLAKPMVLVPGDRFVLRLPSPTELIGGGRVLDVHPVRRWRKAVTRQWLEPLRAAPLTQQLLARIKRRGMAGLSLPALENETALRAAALLKALQAPITAKQLIAAKIDQPQFDHFIEPEALMQAAELIFRELKRKDSRASGRAELLSKTRLEEWVFPLALQLLLDARRVRIDGAQILVNEAGAGGAAQSPLLARVEEIYRAAGLASPLVSEVAAALQIAPKDVPPLVTQLLRTGRLVRMGSDTLMIHADALTKLKADLAKLRGQRLDVGQFKDLAGVSRKYAIPLLEWLDRMRVTSNQQGVRTVL